jgi:hypothetical protein
MGDIELKADLKKHERVSPALFDGLREGLEESGNWMLENGTRFAYDYVVAKDRVWNKQVKRGFTTNENQFSRRDHWQGTISNEAPHADMVEDGRPPGTEIDIAEIVPWVDDRLTPNSDAREKAEDSNVSAWDQKIRGLAWTHGTANVITAFAVKRHLEKEGYPGIGFMDTTESYLEQVSGMVIKGKIEREMERELKKALRG